MSRNHKSPSRRALDYLRVAHRFRLGSLPTEQPHPATRDLSRWARDDLATAVAVLKDVDIQALQTLESYAPAIDRLAARVGSTLAQGRRVFLCGCGATGRLCLSLEFLWRGTRGPDSRVRSLMAGGDVALVHALEGFEDDPAFGARHLEDTGFADGDLLIGCTEGGETPYVIGATERAAEISANRPFFLYCNPDSVLNRDVARFRRVHADRRIEKICLYVGPMALAGSTRMQASTVLQLAVGLALLHPNSSAGESISRFRRWVESTDFSFLPSFVEKESAVYLAGQHVLYRVRDYGITVFTDTTERAPTFSLAPFGRVAEHPPGGHSLCYVVLDRADGHHDAWDRLLRRKPRPLNWPEVDTRTTPAYMHGFDFSNGARKHRLPGKIQREFRIEGTEDGIRLRFEGLDRVVNVGGQPELFRHLLLKQMLNIHSTLVMGRLARYESNLMTWVTPTNGKLVDRAARYVEHLLSHAGRTDLRYEDIVCRLFTEMDRVRSGESVVLRTYRSLLRVDRRSLSEQPPRPDRPEHADS